jgi:hypothetical protein
MLAEAWRPLLIGLAVSDADLAALAHYAASR